MKEILIYPHSDYYSPPANANFIPGKPYQPEIEPPSPQEAPFFPPQEIPKPDGDNDPNDIDPDEPDEPMPDELPLPIDD